MQKKNYPKWLSSILYILSISVLSTYVTMEVMLDKEIELYRYILTFIFGYMFYCMANKKED
jgi:hypothetical protein